MTQTPFSKQTEILGTFWLEYRDSVEDDEGWTLFFLTQDVALPLAYMLWQGLAVPQDEALPYIESTWGLFCTLLDIDPNGDYDSLESAFDASPNERNPEEEED